MPKCKGCKKYAKKDELIRVGLSSFCDWDCYSESQNQKPKTKSKKLATKSKTGYNESLSSSVRETVRQRDSNRCRLCGGNNNLIFHHVIYKSDKKNKPWQDTVSNGITLCNEPCHLSVVHKNKERYQPLCLGVIWLREVQGDRYTGLLQLEKRLKNDR